MSEIFKNENDATALKNNKIIYDNVKFLNTQILFNGVGNFVYIESGTIFNNVKINVSGNNNFIYIGCSNTVSLDITIFNNSIIYIGSNNYYNGPLHILCAEESIVFIGCNNLFSTGVYLRTSDAHLIYSRNGVRLNRADDIFIGNQVWICDDVKILKGSEIYSNVVIGTKSLVTSNICYSDKIYTGYPVRKIKSNIYWRGNCSYGYGDNDFDKWNVIRKPCFEIPSKTISFSYIKNKINCLRFDFLKLSNLFNSEPFKNDVRCVYSSGNTELQNQKRIYTMNVQQWEKLFKINFVDESPLGIKEVCNGYILPTKCIDKAHGFFAGGVVDANKKYVAGFKRHRSNKGYYCCEEAYEFNESSTDLIDETVVFGGVLVNHFGHFMLEGFSRLWYLINHPSLPYKYRIVFCTINGKAVWYNNFLELAGIPLERVLFINKITKFTKIIIPDESIMSWDQIHPEYFLSYDYMINNARKKCNGMESFTKIYLSKSSYSAGCKCIGEEYFEKFFEKKGFKILYPETISIAEMVYLVSRAKEIVTSLGTLSHYFLFADESCKVVILTRTYNDTLYPQALINTVKHLNYYIVDVSLNFFYAIRFSGVSLLGVTKTWKDFVNDYYGEVINDETDSKYIFEYLKSFYEMYKNPSQFKTICNKGMGDVFQRLGILFGEKFSGSDPSLVKKYDHLNDPEYYKYQLYLIKENPNLVGTLDKRMYLKYSGHFSKIGDIDFKIENSVLGSTVQNNHIEGITIDFVKQVSSLGLKYAVLYGDGQWSDLVSSGVFCGSMGKSIPVKGIQVILFSPNQDNVDLQNLISLDGLKYLLQYRIFDSTRRWSEWANNGDKLCSSDNKEIFAVQIRLISDL